jgi:hypothetical protein
MQTRLGWRLTECAFCGSLESGGRFCVGAFGKNLASVAVKMFLHLIYLSRKFFNCVLSMRLAALHCITVQHK